MTESTAITLELRPQEEILHRLRHDDFGFDVFGAIQTDLTSALTRTNGQLYVPEVNPEAAAITKWELWTDDLDELQAEVINAARSYIPFAIEKAEGHRGIAAGRSVQHLSTWVWLLTDNATTEEFDGIDYPNYGAGQVIRAAEIFGVDAQFSDAMQRMARGLSCDPDGCFEGCGQ